MNDARINISAELDGANPKADGIVRLDENHFILNIFSETTIESFRMETLIINNSCKEQIVYLEINWPSVPFSELRDCFYWKHDQMLDWITVPADTAPGKSFITIVTQPGKGLLCLHPHYGYDDCERFISRLPDNRLVAKKIIEKTETGRNIWQINISEHSCKNEKLKFLICARNHANESSGNYCIEGMIEWLLKNQPAMPYFLKKIDFYFLPMTNPDGVADGMARCTGIRGTDLNRTAEWLHKTDILLLICS